MRLSQRGISPVHFYAVPKSAPSNNNLLMHPNPSSSRNGEHAYTTAQQRRTWTLAELQRAKQPASRKKKPLRTHRRSRRRCLCSPCCSRCGRTSHSPEGPWRRSTVPGGRKGDKGRLHEWIRPSQHTGGTTALPKSNHTSLQALQHSFFTRTGRRVERTSKLYWVPKYSNPGSAVVQTP